MSKDFFSIPTIPFVGKTLCSLPFSVRLHVLKKFLNIFHIQILKIEKCNKDVNLLFYKIVFYKILRFVLPDWEFSIKNLKKIHCVLLDLEGLKLLFGHMVCENLSKKWKFCL